MFKQKSASKNFTKEDLPSNRKEVFLDRFKNQFSVLFKSGLILLLFFVPFIVVHFLKDYSLWSMMSKNELTNIEYDRIQILYSIIDIPLYLILSIGFSGAFRVIKNLAWDIPVFFKEDFKEGIKKNYKQFMLVFFVFSFLKLLCQIALSISNIPEFFSYLPYGFLIGIIVPITLTSLNIFNLYNAKYFEAMRLSLRFFFGKAFKSILAILIVTLPLFILLIPNFIIKYILFIFAILFLIPCSLLGWFLYNCYLFDIYMNKKNYPEIYDKGIYRKENKHAKD